MIARLERKVGTGAMLLCLSACGGGEVVGGNVDGSRGITQGGPQDVALFREILDRGEIPAPEVLDQVGFFAEHALDLPPATCGQDVCVHASLAVAPRFDDTNWTMAFVALNTPVDPQTVPRPPAHVVLAVERSSYLIAAGEGLAAAVDALGAALRPEDLVSLVVFDDRARTLVHGVAPGDAVLGTAIANLAAEPGPGPGVALYDGLATAGQAARAVPDVAARVLLLTSGRAEVGITDSERIVALGEGLASEGIALGVIGMGEGFQPRIPSALGDIGAGAFSFARDAGDLADVFELEAETTLFPLATRFELTLQPAPGYRVGRLYGARRARVDNRMARLSSPALFVAHREGSTDVAGGRRGGGGGFFVELIADSDAGIAAGQPAFAVTASWNDGETDEPDASNVTVVNAMRPGQNPSSGWVELSDVGRAQAFMMLNMYLGLRGSVELYEEGDCARAMGLLDMMEPAILQWQDVYDNPDVAADYEMMEQLRDNLDGACEAQEPIEPQNFRGSCMVT